MNIFFYIILPLFIAFTLWLGAKILDKAGFDKRWTFGLLIPVINIFIIWAFAFSNWPNLKNNTK